MDNNDIRCRIMEEELKTFWPQWHVEKRLGGGSFGDVFQIYKDNYGIRVWSALKVIQISNAIAEETVPIVGANPNYASHQNSAEELPKELLNEIQIMETLRGAPNIVSIDDFYFQRGSASSSLYVRMELLTSFQDVMTNRQRNNKQFTIAEVLKIGRDICTALMFCEERGIIHRDIKPANLFVDAFGSYKVGDFGASKRMETVHATHTMTGIGTISYMAPEIFAGRSYNNTVDIYALGMVLYQLLNNGRVPFLPANSTYTTQDIDNANFRRLRGEKIPSLTGIQTGGDTVDAQLDGIIRKACSANSHNRYRTAKEFYDALAGYENRRKEPKDLTEAVRQANKGNKEKHNKNEEEKASGTAKNHETGVKPEKTILQAEPRKGNQYKQFPLLLVLGICVVAFIIVLCIVKASSPVLHAPIQSVSAGHSHNAVIDEEGDLWTWGSDMSSTDGGFMSNPDEPTRIMKGVKAASFGSMHSAVIDDEGNLWTWGANEHGQLGDGTTENSSKLVKVMEDVKSVSLGFYSSAAIKTDGSLWTWGYNDNGKLGDGTTKHRLEPIKIMDDVQSVAMGHVHSAAIKTDGSLWLWGWNKFGQLGDGTQTDHSTPVKIMDHVKAVSLGGYHSLALKTDGSLWAWGMNDYGQLGDGTTKNRLEPVKIMDDVQSISPAMCYFSAAVKTDGSLWTWGRNDCGQLGDGTTKNRLEPVKIMDDVKSVSLGLDHGVAIKADGTLWLWGDDILTKSTVPVCVVE